MEEEDMLMTDNTKKISINKKSAMDKANDLDFTDMDPNKDEADDTVFIDNLPKDTVNLKNMIREVNKQIRYLEKQFFEEEDSEIENDLK